MDEKKKPTEWCHILDVRVMDPDGWNAAGRTWFEPVTQEEFEEMLKTSTIDWGYWSRRRTHIRDLE